jgi:pyrroloquinoline quinone biosynthesis protein B
VEWRDLPLRREIELDGGLGLEARPTPGKLPVHLMGLCEPSPQDNVSLWFRDAHSGKRSAYLGATSSASGLAAELDAVDCVFFDGTFWSSDELVRLGLGSSRAEDMAHLPIGGETGSLAALASIRTPRKIFTHVNNSNPILVDGSLERRSVQAAGWEVAFDGMEVTL